MSPFVVLRPHVARHDRQPRNKANPPRAFPTGLRNITVLIVECHFTLLMEDRMSE